VSESYPHLIFEGFSTKLGQRVVQVLKHLFPPREATSKVGNRVVTYVSLFFHSPFPTDADPSHSFKNIEDTIEVRHHVFVKTGYQSVELAEVGPRMSMRLFEIRAGTLDNKEGDVEWHLNQYTRTGRKKEYL
jgi:U3 small nucleolar ribonucleoprotein protein IMP4